MSTLLPSITPQGRLEARLAARGPEARRARVARVWFGRAGPPPLFSTGGRSGSLSAPARGGYPKALISSAADRRLVLLAGETGAS